MREEKTVRIPETIDGKKVEAIGAQMLANRHDIEEVYLPSTVESINDYAFQNCTNLKKVHLNEGLIDIRNHAFENCQNLQEITLPTTTRRIYSNAFSECIRLKKVYLNENLFLINENAFKKCIALEEITIPAIVQNISVGAFDSCYDLKKVTLNTGIKIIELNAFKGCESLEEITFPSTVEKVENSAFRNCYKLKKVNLNEGLISIGYRTFINCKSLEEIVLPKTLNNLEDISFENCTNLKQAVLLNNLQFKAEIKFKNTPNLSYVNINLFKNFDAEKQSDLVIKLFDNTNICTDEEKENLIEYINKKTDVKRCIFTKSVAETIAQLIDRKITLTLEEVNEYLEHAIENNHITITSMLFEYKNNNFTQQYIKNTQEDNELVDIGLKLPSIKQLKAKWNIKQTPNGIKIIGYKGRKTTETIPESTIEGTPIIDICNAKANGNTYEPLEVLTIDAKLEVLEIATFYNCTTIKEINLPKTLNKICHSCFYCCYNLEKLNIPESLKIFDGNPFAGTNLVDENGYIIICDTIYDYQGTDQIITLPKGVKNIGQNAFFSKDITEITFNNDLEKIANNAFNSCTELEKVTLPKTVALDKENVFRDCNKLKEIIEY